MSDVRLARDDLGLPVVVPQSVRRIVSLVPSLTETLACSGAADRLVGVTKFCTHPPGLVAHVDRVGGTKNPDVAAIVALGPDLVVANAEENREEDLNALRAEGLAVWVTAPTTVPSALTSIGRLLAACRLGPDASAWFRPASAAWPIEMPPVTRRAFVPIWRRPWMSLGHDTFAGDLLARLGIGHVYADATDRYPKIDLDDARARRPDLVLLPDEPYVFGADDRDDFAGWGVPVALISGRHLTWYGPSLVEARDVLLSQIDAAGVVPSRG